MTEMVPTLINGRWTLLLPEHRSQRGVYPEGTPHAGDPVWDWWECERLASMHDLLKPGDLVVDVGAEEGDLSALYASWGCRVFLAEPNPKVWPNIRAIFEANGLKPVSWFVGFLGDKSDGHRMDGASCLDTDGNAIWPISAYGEIIGDHGFMNLSENDNPERPTSERRIDDYRSFGLAHARPDAITIDVEGSELRVLRGAEQTLRRDRPLVWLSLHPEFMAEQYGDDPQQIFGLMADLGYHAKLLADVHEEHWVFWHPETHGDRIG